MGFHENLLRSVNKCIDRKKTRKAKTEPREREKVFLCVNLP